MSILDRFKSDLSAKKAEVMAERKIELVKNQLQGIVEKLARILAGKLEVTVEVSTDSILRFVRLGGLAEFEQEFRDFFTKRPDLFFVYAIQDLWAMLVDRPDLQDVVAEVYYNRGLNYVPVVDDSTADFPWVIKGALAVFQAAGADKPTMSTFANELYYTNEMYFKMEEHQHLRSLLYNVKRSGEFRMNRQQVVVGSEEEKADPTQVAAADGFRARKIPAKKYAATVNPLQPTAEDSVALKDFKAKNGKPPANYALAKLGNEEAVVVM